MKALVLNCLSILIFVQVVAAQSPAPSDLTVTLPSGKVLTFQTAEQKATYLAAREKVQSQAQGTASPATGQKTAEQAKAEWDKDQADKKAKADLDAKTKAIWFRIEQVGKEGVLANWGPSAAQCDKGEVFISCAPDARWAEGIIFKAPVFADGAHAFHGRRLPNYGINGEVSYP